MPRVFSVPSRSCASERPHGATVSRVSQANDRDSRSKSFSDRSQVILVRSDDSDPTPMGDHDNVDIDDVSRTRSTGERTDLVGFIVSEGDDFAAPQQAP